MEGSLSGDSESSSLGDLIGNTEFGYSGGTLFWREHYCMFFCYCISFFQFLFYDGWMYNTITG
jgi:hypothetical protein